MNLDNPFFRIFVSIPGKYRRLVSLLVQLILSVVSFFLCSALHMEFNFSEFPSDMIFFFLLFLVPVRFLTIYFFKLDRPLWQYSSIPDLVQIIKASATGTALLVIIALITEGQNTFLIVSLVMDLGANILLIGVCRLIVRRMVNKRRSHIAASIRMRLLLIGANDEAERLLRNMIYHEVGEYEPVVILDEDIGKQGTSIHGVSVSKLVLPISVVLKDFKIDQLVLADRSLSQDKIKLIYDSCLENNVTFKILDSSESSIDLNNLMGVQLRDIEIAD